VSQVASPVMGRRFRRTRNLFADASNMRRFRRISNIFRAGINQGDVIRQYRKAFLPQGLPMPRPKVFSDKRRQRLVGESSGNFSTTHGVIKDGRDTVLRDVGIRPDHLDGHTGKNRDRIPRRL
jgi:hypothetical protein